MAHVIATDRLPLFTALVLGTSDTRFSRFVFLSACIRSSSAGQLNMAAVAHLPGQHNVHPLLRHPRPITRDSAKAQRMLGLIAETEEKLSGLHREKSKTTKWLERPMYAHLDVSDVESERGEDHEDKVIESANGNHDDEKDASLSKQWIPNRSTSFSSEDAVQTAIEPKAKLDSSFNKRRPESLATLRPVSYNSHHLSPEWTASPATMSPNTQRQRPFSMQPTNPHVPRSSLASSSSSDSIPKFIHTQTWPEPSAPRVSNGPLRRPVSYQQLNSTSAQGDFASLETPQLKEGRPRPTSFATYQHRDRRTSKIASSRGLRNNSYPNFSRPISEIGPKAVPGEHIESPAMYNRFEDSQDGPPSPPSPMRSALEAFALGSSENKDEKKSKNRWSTIPSALKKLTMKRSSIAQDSEPGTTLDGLRRMDYTEENVLCHDCDGSRTPSVSHTSGLGVKLLPTPTYSPLELKHPLFQGDLPRPFAPWADAPPSPAFSQDKHRGSDASLSPTRKRAQSRLSVENIIPKRPESFHSRNSSVGMPSPKSQAPPPMMAMELPASPRLMSGRGTPSLERTCIICKLTKEPSTFVNRRISANCWHEPATCFPCLQSHIERCVVTQGWESCTCPECGERMTYDDIGSFADDDKLVKWEE
jgi:hypothetical protein